MRRLDSVELMDYIKVYENGNISMSLLLTDNSSIITVSYTHLDVYKRQDLLIVLLHVLPLLIVLRFAIRTFCFAELPMQKGIFLLRNIP